MSDALLTNLLAQRRETTAEVIDVDEPSQQLVLLRMGDESYAIAGQAIREILAQPEVFFVPGCPNSLEGVINLRGQIETVIRLHEILGCRVPETGSAPYFVLIAQTPQLRTGIRAEAIIDMIELGESAMQPPPSSLPTHLQPYVSKLLTYQQQPIALLNLEQLLADYAQTLA